MAYDIFYYRRTNYGFKRLPELDKVSDLPETPATWDGSIAHATNSTDATLNRFGVAGAWYELPPVGWDD